MTEAAAMELAVSSGSGLIKSGFQLAKKGTRKVTSTWDRSKGLKLLKNLPVPLEAFVFGEDDVTPELLAALSLGGTPGVQLSMIALLKARVLGDDEGVLLSFVLDPPYTNFNKKLENRVSLMDGGYHEFTWLDDQMTHAKMHVPKLPPEDPNGYDEGQVVDYSLLLSTRNEVYAFVSRGFFGGARGRGLVMRSPHTDCGEALYCENNVGSLKCSLVTIPDSMKDVSFKFKFTVDRSVLEHYSAFQRLTDSAQSVKKLFGLQKVAKRLGEEFAAQSTRDGITLLSRQYLKLVHTNLGDTLSLRMPTNEELQTRVNEATASFTLDDRDARLVLFPTVRKLISDYVKAVETKAARHGNVGVQPYKRNNESNLIKSCIVQAAGMKTNFSIFEGFRESKLNIAVSPGCTAVYFPGLSLTVAFPEGFEEGMYRSMVLRPACPFTTDLRESLPILLELARKLAGNTLMQFANTLSLELAKDPALALSPVTDAVVRVLSSTRIWCDGFSLKNIFDDLKGNPKSTWGEASVAGILCQLGMSFFTPPGGGSEVEGFQCFFKVCREVWPPTCWGAELVVDCAVDISGCEVWKVRRNWNRVSFFLRTVDPYSGMIKDSYGLTGEVADVPWENLHELRECVGSLRHHTGHDMDEGELVHIPVPCRVIGFGSPPVKTSTEKILDIFGRFFIK